MDTLTSPFGIYSIKKVGPEQFLVELDVHCEFTETIAVDCKDKKEAIQKMIRDIKIRIEKVKTFEKENLVFLLLDQI